MIGTARVLVVDDNALARAGLRNLLGDQRRFQIVGEADNGADALVQSRALRPDLLLVDLNMPTLDGLEVTRAVKCELPKTRVVILTADESPGRLLEALRRGADAYVLKGGAKPGLVGTLREAMAGEPLVQQEIATYLLQVLQCAESTWRSSFSELPTSIEMAVLKCAADGYSPLQMARALGLNRPMLSAHMSHLLAKLGVFRARARRYRENRVLRPAKHPRRAVY